MGARELNSSLPPQLELPVDTQALARALIGVELVSELGGERTSGRIVETEAYVLGDPASHAFRGPRPRNKAMFGPPFHAYVYRIYGMYWCFNVASEPHGHGAGVLVRALEPAGGIDVMRRRRGCDDVRLLCSGPSRLCQALGIDRAADGVALLGDGPLRLEPSARTGRIGRSRRIGISQAAHRLLRFYERGSPYISGPRSLSP
jgi:DNA-3-methyladenine glycosylase